MKLKAGNAYFMAMQCRCIPHRGSTTGVLLVLMLATPSPVFAAQLLPHVAMPGAMNNPAQAVAPNVAALVMPPYKPTELGSVSVSATQATVRWKMPDQSGGRAIGQWLIRACPKADGNPACQQVQAMNGPGGQASGTYVQAQIPSHVMYKGIDTPVNGAEICAANRGGTTCADRILLNYAVPNSAAAPITMQNQAGALPTGNPPGAILVPPTHGFGSALQTGGIPPAGAGASKTADLGATRTGLAGGEVRVKPATMATAKLTEPIVLTTNALLLKIAAPSPIQDIHVETDPLQLKVAAKVAPSDIVVAAMSLRLSVRQESARSGLAAISIVGPARNSVTVNASPLSIKVTEAPPVKPIVVATSPLTLKVDMIPPPAPISVSTAMLKMTLSKP